MEARSNRQLFDQALKLSGWEAVARWQACLMSGDMMAHYALGYELLELGEPDDALRHLLYYAEASPDDPWAWRYLGRALEAVGYSREAEAALEQAVTIEADGTEVTDAAALLSTLRALS